MPKITKNIQSIHKSAKDLEKEVRKHIITAITAAFAFIIALFWRDAIQAMINEVLGKIGINTDIYIYKIVAAILVTIIAVIGIIMVARLEKKDGE
jgi:ABC-type Mn2+/Zn2+ transport system permease subunit